jgi:hypothetical protein
MTNLRLRNEVMGVDSSGRVSSIVGSDVKLDRPNRRIAAAPNTASSALGRSMRLAIMMPVETWNNECYKISRGIELQGGGEISIII